NWRSKMSLGDYLRINNKIAIEGVDTRALTAHLRDNGSQMGIISTEDSSVENLLKKVRFHPGIGGLDLVKYETTDRVHSYREGIWSWERGCYPHIDDEKAEYSILVYDFGVKLNILRNLVSSGFKTIVVPASTPAEEVLNIDPDAILLSNGPGNPAIVAYAIENTKKLIGKKPLFGICFGHQIIGLALGGEVYKLKFGHHGANHPVKDLYTGKVVITSQNHNYCVDIKSLKGAVELTHRNLYDGTEEGLRHKELSIFSVQYHPEASPGPNDSSYIFRRFRDIVRTS
ncbi:MAG: carbamoyl-phosphate synthase small subunit, partial [Nitrospirae bacterium]